MLSLTAADRMSPSFAPVGHAYRLETLAKPVCAVFEEGGRVRQSGGGSAAPVFGAVFGRRQKRAMWWQFLVEAEPLTEARRPNPSRVQSRRCRRRPLRRCG